MGSTVVSALSAEYQACGISLQGFNCPHLSSCAATVGGQDNLWLGSEAYVGRRYGEPFPLVIASLDRDEAGLNMMDRRDEVESLGVSELPLHMKGTLHLLTSLLGLAVSPEAWLHFALINTAKCSTRTGAKSHEFDLVLRNCADYARREIRILRPRLIVTQGIRANLFLDGHTRAFSGDELAALTPEGLGTPVEQTPGLRRLKFLTGFAFNAVVLETVHPSAWQGSAWVRFRDEELPALCLLARAAVQHLQ